MIKKQLNKNQSSCKVTFSLPVESVGEGRDVRVVGDFNEWSWKDGARMKAQKGKYSATLEVPANGRYEFRYCVEGNHWLNDPEADDYSFNAYGTQNCVMTIEDISAAVSPTVASPETSINETTAGFPEQQGATAKGKRSTRGEGAIAKAPSKGTRGATGGDATADRGTTQKKTTGQITSKTTTGKGAAGKNMSASEQVLKGMSARSAGTSDPAVKGTAAKSKKVGGNARIGAEPAKDNLTMIEGVGPKIEELLRTRGINSFRELADASNDTLRDVLSQAGARYRMHNPATWQEQARLAADHKWEELTNMQRDLKGGRR